MRPDGVKCMDQRSVTILILWVDPGGWKSKWLIRRSAETKIQTSLVGLLILSFAGLVSLTFWRDFCKRVNSPTFFNLVLILSSPRADIDRHLFVVLWAFLLTVTCEQTERAVGKELGQLVGTKPITVSHQHAQIEGQYWPPCLFGGHVRAWIKHFSNLRIVDMGVVAGWSWADENLSAGELRGLPSYEFQFQRIWRVRSCLPFCMCLLLFFWGGLPHVIAVNLEPDPVNLNSSRSGKENDIRAFPSRF